MVSSAWNKLGSTIYTYICLADRQKDHTPLLADVGHRGNVETQLTLDFSMFLMGKKDDSHFEDNEEYIGLILITNEAINYGRWQSHILLQFCENKQK